MSQNGQTHFKNLAANAHDHFGTLCIKGLRQTIWTNLMLSLIASTVEHFHQRIN